MAQVETPAQLGTKIHSSTEQNANELAERLRWVIGLRWTVVIALLLVGLLGNSLRGDEAETSAIHLGLALLVLLYNLLYFYASVRPDFGQSTLTTIVRFSQVPVDLIVFTVLVHLSGGFTTPVFVLYFLYVFIGLAILPPSGAYLVAAMAAICYGALVILEALGLKAPVGHLVGTASKGALPVEVYFGYFLVVSTTLMITAYIANYFAGLLTRDESTIRSQLGEMNALYNITRKMSTTLNSNTVLDTLTSMLRESAAPDSIAVMLFNDQGEGVCGATDGMDSSEQHYCDGRHVTIEHPVIKQIMTDHKGVYAPDVDLVPNLKSLMWRQSAESFYVIPMVNDNRVIGMVSLSFDRKQTLSPSHWDLLVTMAQQAALALERSRLFADAERAASEMTVLYDIGLATTSSLNIDEVLRLIYGQVKNVVHPDTFYIALYEEELAELRFDIFVENGEFLPPFKTKMEGGTSAWVIRNRKPVFVSNWNMEIEQLPFEAGVGSPTQSVIRVPLVAKDKLVGVMSVEALEPHAFDLNHLRLLTSIASQAALALENAKLHEQVREQAQRDSLTGAYNHGALIEKLEIAMRQTDLDKQPLAFIMLDVDRFKQYNDTHGHLVGDDVLRATVLSIRGHLKNTDVVGRWGGEEFAIILPGVNRAQAKSIAERIRQTAAHTMLKDTHNKPISSPTVSQGIAMYPADATGMEELIDKADTALFRAKDQGRNQISDWIELEPEHGPLTFRARG